MAVWKRVGEMAVQQCHRSSFDEFRISSQQLVQCAGKPSTRARPTERGGRDRASAFLLRKVFPVRNLPEPVRLQMPEGKFRVNGLARRSEAPEELPERGFQFFKAEEPVLTPRKPAERQEEQERLVRRPLTAAFPDVQIVQRLE